MPGKLKLLVVGVDGAAPAIIRSAPRLAHLHSLMRDGCWGVVKGPAFSMDRWATYYTGLSPQQHGIQARRLNNASGTNLKSIHASKFLWDYVNEAGLRFGMFRGLMCWPPVPVKGFWATIQLDQFHPPEAAQCVPKLDGWGGKPYPSLEALFKQKSWSQVRPQEVAEILARFDSRTMTAWVTRRVRWTQQILDEMTRRWPVDVLWVYLPDLDHAQHWAFYNKPTVVDCYKVVDDFIGHAKAQYDPTYTLVVSDHGFQPVSALVRSRHVKTLPNGLKVLPGDRIPGVMTGEHHEDAFYTLVGPGVPAGRQVNLDFTQIFPLMLQVLGIPRPA